jgi:hypothetical protein
MVMQCSLVTQVGLCGIAFPYLWSVSIIILVKYRSIGIFSALVSHAKHISRLSLKLLPQQYFSDAYFNSLMIVQHPEFRYGWRYTT